MNTPRNLALAMAAALALSACGGAASTTTSSSPSSTAASTDAGSTGAEVTLKSIAFKPPRLKVLRGTEVTWTNDDDVAHTATSGEPGERAVAGVSKGSKAKADGVFDGDLPKAGSTFAFTFEEAGTFAYFCEIHPSMTGEIVVE